MFHQRDGFYVERLEGGAVRVVKHGSLTPIERSNGVRKLPIILDHVIPPNEWASIIAAVCARGENGESYRDALDFHMAIPASGGPDAPGGEQGVIRGSVPTEGDK